MTPARLLATAATLILTSLAVGQDAAMLPLAHFRFDGDLKDISGNENTVTANNVRFKDDALYANGRYGAGGGSDALTCNIGTPSLDYDAFTLAIRFKPHRIRDHSYRNIITGGRAYRWFSLAVAGSGDLRVKLNNHEFERDLPFKLVANQWATIVCGVDLSKRVVRVHANGRDLPPIQLDEGFELKVASSNRKETDKVWTFANHSNATVFHGLVDELVIYDGMLTPEEVARLEITRTHDQRVNRDHVPTLTGIPPSTVLKGHTSAITALAWSKDGKAVATASDDRTIRVWNPSDGQQTSLLTAIARQGYGSPVVAFTADLKSAAVNYWGEITIRHVADGRVLTTIDPILDRGQRSAFRPDVFAMAFSPDGRRLATAGSVAAVGGPHGLPGGIVIVWDSQTGKIIHKSPKLSTAASAVAWRNDGKQFAVGTNGAGGELEEAGEVHLWDAATGKVLKKFPVKEETKYGEWASAGDVALSPNGKRVAVPVIAGGRASPAGIILQETGATVKLWQLETGKATQPLPVFDSPVEQIVFSPDGQRLATAGRDNFVRLWDIITGTQLAALASPSPVTVVAFQPVGKLLAAGGEDGSVNIWKLDVEPNTP